MTEGLQAHAAAFIALLGADVGPPPLVVFDGKVPDPLPDPPYVLCYFSSSRAPDAAANSLNGKSSTIELHATCHCVGRTAATARTVAGRVEAAVLDRQPAVTGWVPGKIRQDDNREPVRDETIGVLVMDAVQAYRWMSRVA